MNARELVRDLTMNVRPLVVDIGWSGTPGQTTRGSG